ncbi:MAG TPA: HlyD family type I secretion periplasmic adaptor subunit [Burkholderiaceae bacterium]|uniref:HlyD family type I secretion periplasmic adaptor subunit n=1 Tax=Accumulibacter sp. TaxID=2053492 RepID=UPI002C35C6F9|nr:HlyD family type I secretion periplasmic adaptor subunit [Accumulibacter sp.]HMW54792.1 HlyD family type I secretion periplasmic adaptor subunit [Accumulibacter sp.]HMX11134.1 HlyD family type I secretion periplasmic adaptor subunit [Burkholderiaceae bacterium]HNB44978.1 HlyD family type I secretion periplasmic adaptor subunit [Burkholderiaceae bacterium]HNG77958.1 HlyD family type I secretion periplasmic adaptor subunit [Burkholderiaceae bacterium]
MSGALSGAPSSVRGLLDDRRLPSPAEQGLRRLIAAALVTLVLLLLLFVLWAMLSPLSGAVVSTGVVRTEHNRKTIQHQEGGLVQRILVRDGQAVKAGEILAVIGDVRTDAGLDLLRDQRAADELRKARLEAEVAFAADFQVPAESRGAKGLADLLQRERKVFVTRRATVQEQLAALAAQSTQAVHQTEALQTQLDATAEALRLADEELQLNQKLATQGFVQQARLIGLQRVVAEYQSRMGEQRSELAKARQAIEDLRLRAAQARNAYQQQAADEMKETALRLREVDEKLRPSADLAERQNVRAPVAGTVMGLRVAAVGVAVGPRETLMELIPAEERLMIEANVRTQDIDHVRVGGAAEIRFTAFQTRNTPHLPAKVEFVSPDRVTEPQTGAAWYVARLSVADEALRALPHLRLQTGMPAEVYIATEPRSMWEYLMEPLDVFRHRALREP